MHKNVPKRWLGMLGNLYTCLCVAALACQRTLFGEQVGEGRAETSYCTIQRFQEYDPAKRGVHSRHLNGVTYERPHSKTSEVLPSAGTGDFHVPFQSAKVLHSFFYLISITCSA